MQKHDWGKQVSLRNFSITWTRKKCRSASAKPISFGARVSKPQLRVFFSSVENECTRFRSNAKSLFYLKVNQPGCSLLRVINPVLYSNTICHYKEGGMKFYKDFSVLFWFHEYAAFQVCKYTKSYHSKRSLKLSLAICLFSFLSRWLLCTQNKLSSHLFSLYGPRINFINRSWHMTWLLTKVKIVLISWYKNIIGKAIDIIKYILFC